MIKQLPEIIQEVRLAYPQFPELYAELEKLDEPSAFRNLLLPQLDRLKPEDPKASAIYSILIGVASNYPTNEFVCTISSQDLSNQFFVPLSTGEVFHIKALGEWIKTSGGKHPVQAGQYLSPHDAFYLENSYAMTCNIPLQIQLLFEAIRTTHLSNVREMLGQQPNLLSQRFGFADAIKGIGSARFYNALGYAAYLKNLEVLKVLIEEFHANPNESDREITPLNHLLDSDNGPYDPNSRAFQCAEYLVNQGADPDLPDGRHASPRERAEKWAPSLTSSSQGGENCLAVFSRNDSALLTFGYQLKRNVNLTTAVVVLGAMKIAGKF